ncbi:hypothetical protein C2S51_019563 [Perilla frutescens var. frutescens]|nr:hypothetical protein C2S51_019563 [Perilla frutescens var. frutescens]
MDYILIANVLFLHTMIFGYDQTHMIDDWVWVLVEDQDRWNSFPWGAYAFSLLQHYMGLVPSTDVELRRKFKKTEEKASLSYHFYGPVLALLVWAYEALPRLGAHCAQVSSPATLPRCSKWTISIARFLARNATLYSTSIPYSLNIPAIIALGFRIEPSSRILFLNKSAITLDDNFRGALRVRSNRHV